MTRKPLPFIGLFVAAGVFAGFTLLLPSLRGSAQPATIQTQGVIFQDDFSTDTGWTDATSGHFYRDTGNEWLVWHVDRAVDERYYQQIGPYSGDFRLQVRVKATYWQENGSFLIGLAEDLYGGWPGVGHYPTGLFVNFGWYGAFPGGNRVLAAGYYTDEVYHPPAIPYPMDQWVRAVLEVVGSDWTLDLYGDSGVLLGHTSGTFPRIHETFNYILLVGPQDGEWPTGDGLLDDLIVEPSEAHTTPDEAFGYGLSSANPNDDEAYDLGFNWVQVYDVPTGPQPTKVLYRVKADADSRADLSAFYWQMHALAGTYGDYIDAYEIGNEVNIDDEWNQPPNASHYVDILCTARYAIHQVDPTAKIISAGLAPVGRIAERWYGHAGHNGAVQDEREYLKEFLIANGQLCADAIGYHPMGFRADYDAEPDIDGGTPETNCSDGFCFRSVEKIHEVLQQYGLDDFKIWATEVGWIVEPADECIGHPSWQGRYWQIVSAQKQAENLTGAFRYARFHWPWLEALFVFNLDFNTAPYYEECEQMNHYSILGRPAATALAAMSKEVWTTHLPLVLRSH